MPRQYDPQTLTGAELNKENLINALNGNAPVGHAHIVYHMDHCSPRMMGASSKDKNDHISVADVDDLDNNGYPMIIMSGGCKPALLDLDCIAEHFINNINHGSVAFIGFANIGRASHHFLFNEFLKALYLHAKTHLGALYEYSILSRNSSFPDTLTDDSPDAFKLHLLGDPEMPVWSDIPQNLSVAVTPNQISSGNNQVSIQVSNLQTSDTAYVCFMKDKEVYLTLPVTDTSVHTFTCLPKTSGTLHVTVTAKNMLPYEKDIPVTVNNGNLVALDGIVGCNTGLVAGSSSTIKCYLKNNGTTTAQNVVAVLETSSPYITISNNTLQYGTISSGSRKFNSTGFAVSVSPDAPAISQGSWISPCFYLKLYKNNNMLERIDTFTVDLLSPVLKVAEVKVRNIMTNPSWQPHAGDVVTLDLSHSTFGQGTRSPISWQVTSTSNYINSISVSGSQCSFNLSNSYQSGTSLPLTVSLMSGSTCLDCLDIDVSSQTISINSLQVSTIPSSEAITLYWTAPTATGSLKYNVYRSDSANGTYVKQNRLPLDYSFIKNENLQCTQTYYYKISVIHNGIEGPLSAPVMAWTTFPLLLQKENYTLNSTQTVSNTPPVLVDADLDGQKEIIYSLYSNTNDGRSVLSVLNVDGTEPFDLDGNVTTFSGFSSFGYSTNCTPTVVDFKGQGEYCITSLACNTDVDGVYKGTCFSMTDNDGDNLPDTLWTQNSFGPVFRGAVCAKIKESDKNKKLIYGKTSRGITILNDDGTEYLSFANNATSLYNSLAVADLDNDGEKEIVCGTYNGVCVWSSDGAPYLREPFFIRSSQTFKCSPVICDLDCDGEKEIVIATRDDISRIYAIKQDGTCIGAFDGTVTMPYPRTPAEGLDHAISVGDINGDGNLEVVAMGTGCVAAWTNTGVNIFNISNSDVFKTNSSYIHIGAPLIADVDGDAVPEIVFAGQNKIYALHGDGTAVTGFPLIVSGSVEQNLCVSDIDNDGLNEIISLGYDDGYINVWKTNGTTIEWGQPRFNSDACGEYISGYKDPLVVTTDMTWSGGSYPNDIYVRSGCLSVPASAVLQLTTGHRIVVLDGGELKIDGGQVLNADIYVKSGGVLTLNGGRIVLQQYGQLDSETGACITMSPSSSVLRHNN